MASISISIIVIPVRKWRSSIIQRHFDFDHQEEPFSFGFVVISSRISVYDTLLGWDTKGLSGDEIMTDGGIVRNKLHLLLQLWALQCGVGCQTPCLQYLVTRWITENIEFFHILSSFAMHRVMIRLLEM